MADQPLLDLTTLVERPTIAIDGERYEILSPDELSVVDHHRLGRQGRRIDALMAQERLTPKQREELTAILRDVAEKIMVGVPEEVRGDLSDTHRLAVAEVFIRLPLQKRMARMQAQQETAAGATQAENTESTGASSRPASSASTAGRRAGGSAKRPSRSSGPTSR